MDASSDWVKSTTTATSKMPWKKTYSECPNVRLTLQMRTILRTSRRRSQSYNIGTYFSVGSGLVQRQKRLVGKTLSRLCLRDADKNRRQFHTHVVHVGKNVFWRTQNYAREGNWFNDNSAFLFGVWYNPNMFLSFIVSFNSSVFRRSLSHSIRLIWWAHQRSPPNSRNSLETSAGRSFSFPCLSDVATFWLADNRTTLLAQPHAFSIIWQSVK